MPKVEFKFLREYTSDMAEEVKLGEIQTNPQCSYCSSGLKLEKSLACAKCHRPYHPDCWAENGLCAIKGCDEKGAVAYRTLEEKTSNEITVERKQYLVRIGDQTHTLQNVESEIADIFEKMYKTHESYKETSLEEICNKVYRDQTLACNKVTREIMRKNGEFKKWVLDDVIIPYIDERASEEGRQLISGAKNAPVATLGLSLATMCYSAMYGIGIFSGLIIASGLIGTAVGSSENLNRLNGIKRRYIRKILDGYAVEQKKESI